MIVYGSTRGVDVQTYRSGCTFDVDSVRQHWKVTQRVSSAIPCLCMAAVLMVLHRIVSGSSTLVGLFYIPSVLILINSDALV